MNINRFIKITHDVASLGFDSFSDIARNFTERTAPSMKKPKTYIKCI